MPSGTPGSSPLRSANTRLVCLARVPFRPPDEALALLAHRTRPVARRLAVVFQSVRPEAGRAALGAFLARYLPRDSVSDDDLWDLYRKYDPIRDRGHLAGYHPL